MLLPHLFLHFSLVFGACNGTSRYRRPHGAMKVAAQKQAGGQSGSGNGLVLPANPGSLAAQSGSNHTDGGQLAANQVAAGQAPGASSSSVAGSTPTGNAGGNPASKMAEAPASGDSSGRGGGMKASFTQYGPCSSAGIVGCGWYSNPGYNAAVSQSLFGTGPGGGAGPACGQCFQLNPDHPGTNSIVVKVNNLCPTDGNPLCSYDKSVDVNFDLCEDDGAPAALFGSSGTQQVNGTYAPVDCSLWTGSGNLT